MAAKQGFQAHLSQASEDAKRAVLNRAPTSIKSHSWLSNLNTTCTIKSAPPRTPEVMTMLSTKHGWLVKRNEQHVWQRRWCCVVPHTFLYYFEAEPLEEGVGEDECVEVTESKKELGNGYQPGGLSPVGIIDLECYTTINRTTGDETVLELCGDAITNPDLRSFYFQSANPDDAETWTKALLSDRHSALKDEREAYRQVCESFPMQLQQCSDMIDSAEEKAHDAQKECYAVRSAAEENRRKVISLVRDALDQPDPNARIENSRQNLLKDLDKILAAPESMGTMNGGAPQAVALLVDYNAALKASHVDLTQELDTLLSRMDRNANTDKRREEQLNATIQNLTAQHQAQMQAKDASIAELQQKLQKMQTSLDDANHNIRGQQMEFNMYQNATKSKLSELHQHKKILKKEVIDLRKKIDELGSETNMLYHKNENLQATVNNEQQRNEVLEKYVSNMEKQVSVQQNMMEMMSVGAATSVVGRVVGGANENGSVSGSVYGNASVDPLNTPYGTPLCTPRGNSNENSNRAGFGAPLHPRPPQLPHPASTVSDAPVEPEQQQRSMDGRNDITLGVINHQPLPINHTLDRNAPPSNSHGQPSSNEQPIINSTNRLPPRATAEGNVRSSAMESRSLDNIAISNSNVVNNDNPSQSNTVPPHHANAAIDSSNDTDNRRVSDESDDVLMQARKNMLAPATSERTMSTTNYIPTQNDDSKVDDTPAEPKESKPSNQLTRRRERYQRAMASSSNTNTNNATSVRQVAPPQPQPQTQTQALDISDTTGKDHSQINKYFDNPGRYSHTNEDNDDDEKSRMSELTEDRTEKNIDNHHEDAAEVKASTANDGKVRTCKDNEGGTGEGGASSSANPAPGTVTSSSTHQQNNQSYPPRFVLGIGATEPEPVSTTATNMRNESGRVGKPPKAHTRSTSVTSTPPVVPSPSNNAQQHYGGRGWSNSLSQPSNDEVTVSTMGSFASVTQLQLQQPPPQPQHTSTQRLSVAQRSRLEAESPRAGVHHLRIPSPARSRNTSPTRERSTSTTANTSGNHSVASIDPHTSSTPSRSLRGRESPSFFSSFGKTLTDAIDNSVLGVKDPSPPGSPGPGHDATSSSSTTASTETPASLPVTPNAASSANSVGQDSRASLAQRQQMQRERQMAFLKEQGLIKDESSVQGGAGGGTPVNASRHGGFLRAAGSFTSDAGSQVSVGSSRRGFWGRRGESDH